MDLHQRNRRNLLLGIFSGSLLAGCVLPREGLGPKYSEDHFYTTDAEEAERALQQLDYTLDGVPVAGYVFPQESSFGSVTTVPLYRLYNPESDDHFYTIDLANRNSAMTIGYINDGVPVAAHVFDVQVPNTVPFFRMWKDVSQGGNHFYTTSVSERDTAVSVHGYQDEGFEGFIYPSNITSISGTVPLYRMYKRRRLR